MLKSTVILLAFFMLEEKLDLNNLRIGRVGKLPVTNKTQCYRVLAEDDGYLLVYFSRKRADSWNTYFFYFKDKDALAEHHAFKQKSGKGGQMSIEFPKTYMVSGTKVSGKETFAIIEIEK